MASADLDGSAAALNPCRCGHPREAHEHYRAGTDCALCPADSPCHKFVKAGGLRDRLTR